MFYGSYNILTQIYERRYYTKYPKADKIRLVLDNLKAHISEDACDKQRDWHLPRQSIYISAPPAHLLSYRGDWRVITDGGTAKLLEREIRKVFGENVAVYDEPEFLNVTGFLKRLCALKINKVISLERAEKSMPDRTQDDRRKRRKPLDGLVTAFSPETDIFFGLLN